MMEVDGPFLKLIRRPVGEAADEAGGVYHELGRGDYDALHWGVDDDLGGEGIERHLVAGLELIEVIGAWGCCGGFVVHHEE